MIYLDSSALVKLVVTESESHALARFLRHQPIRASCSLARTEVLRAVRHLGPTAMRRARDVIERIDLVRVDDELLDAAALLDPRVLRSLDAIHLAAALTLAPELEFVVTYDERMAKAAEFVGLLVRSPGR